MVSGVFPAWNAQPRRTDQRFFHVTPWSAMERLSWNAVNVAYRVEKKSGNTPASDLWAIWGRAPSFELSAFRPPIAPRTSQGLAVIITS